MGDSLLADNLCNCIAVNHDRRHFETGSLHQLPSVKLVNEALYALRSTGLQDLDDEFATPGHIADEAGAHAALLSHLYPRLTRMAPAGRVASHIGCASKTGDTVSTGSGAVSIPVDLERGAHEGVHGVVPDGLTEGPVRPEISIRSHKEDVRPG